VTVAPSAPGRPRPIALGLLAGWGGLLVAGALGGVLGFVAGAAAARRPRTVLVAAAVALVATAALTVLEQPLTEAGIPRFPVNHPAAELFAKLAAVLLLAGLAGTFAFERHSDRARLPRTVRNNSAPERARATPRLPISTIAAIVGAVLLAAFTLWQIGDRRWEGTAPVVAITVLGFAGILAVVERLRSQVSLRLAPMPAAFLGAVRGEHAHMLTGSMWLLAATLVVSLGSFVFWLLVAQRVPAEDLGRATALFSASMFICYLKSVGLPVAVSRYASDRTESSATLFAWALLLTTASSLVAVAVFVALAPESIREGLATWRPSFAWLVVFLLVAGQSISELVDVRLMVLRRWSLVFWRSSLIAVLRLPFLFWVPDTGAAFYVYVVALGGFALTGVAFLVPLAHRDRLRLRPLPTRARRAAQFAGVNYLGLLAVQAPFFAVPFVVLAQVSAVENARFYLSWGVMSVVYISVQMVGQALLVEGGRGGADHRRQAAVALGAGLAIATAATVMSLGLGPLLADLYGSAYAPVATLLPILVAGTIPFAVTTTVLTTARIREHSSLTIAVAAAFAIAVLVPTLLFTASDGALGAAWGWTIGNAIAAVFALFVSRVTARASEVRAPSGATAPLLAPTPGWERSGRRG
jgi:O-antigen/teichoic acid export membrane protein